MKRNWFHKYLIQTAYNAVPIIAIENGSLDGSMEIAVERQLIRESRGGILQKQALALQAEFRSFEQAAAAIVKADSLPDPFTGMQILSTLPFVLSKDLRIGIASDGTFASQAWRISEEAYQNTSGNKFGWWAPDGKEYTDDRSIFRRPTEQMIRALIMPPILKKSLELGLITFEDEKDNNKA